MFVRSYLRHLSGLLVTAPSDILMDQIEYHFGIDSSEGDARMPKHVY